MKIDVLGVKYNIYERTKEADEKLNNCDGYCDKTSKTIVVLSKNSETNLDDFMKYWNKVLRHEIIHAFLFESGLSENFEHIHWGHEETMIDWFAVQFPKIWKVFMQLDILN